MSFQLSAPHDGHLSIRNLKLDGFIPVHRSGAKEDRVQKIVQQLSRSEHGTRINSVLSIAMREMTDEQLSLIEQAVSTLDSVQNVHEKVQAEDIIFVHSGSGQTPKNRHGRSPFASIIENVIPEFHERNLHNLIQFEGLDRSTENLLGLCAVLEHEGVTLTRETVERHLDAMRRVDAVRMMRKGVWVNQVELIRAVEKFPDKIVPMMQLLIDRGSIASLEEVLAVPQSLSEGAL